MSHLPSPPPSPFLLSGVHSVWCVEYGMLRRQRITLLKSSIPGEWPQEVNTYMYLSLRINASNYYDNDALTIP